MNQHFISYYHKSLLQYLKNADIKKKNNTKICREDINHHHQTITPAITVLYALLIFVLFVAQRLEIRRISIFSFHIYVIGSGIMLNFFTATECISVVVVIVISACIIITAAIENPNITDVVAIIAVSTIVLSANIDIIIRQCSSISFIVSGIVFFGFIYWILKPKNSKANELHHTKNNSATA